MLYNSFYEKKDEYWPTKNFFRIVHGLHVVEQRNVGGECKYRNKTTEFNLRPKQRLKYKFSFQ